jgi:tetratricopeptide (TPR) repeat protein
MLARNNIGANLIAECDFNQARAVLEAALQTAREIGDESGIINALTNLGGVFLNQGDFPRAYESLQESLKKSQALDLKSSAAYNLSSIGDANLAQDDLANAEKNYQEALTIRTALGQRGDIASSQLSIAGLKLETNQPAEAVDLARKAADEFKAEKIGDQEALADIVLAQALLAQEKVSDAKTQLDHARQLTPHDKSIVLLLDTTAARLSIAAGKPQEALRTLAGIVTRAKALTLPGYEFQARLAEGEAQAAANARGAANETLQRVEKDSAQAGFKLIARKAAEAQKGTRTPAAN